MRTFQIELTLSLTAVVPEQFTQRMREAVTDPDLSTEFLRVTQEQFGNDDEGFTLHVLKHGLRNVSRLAVGQAMIEQGIGFRLSPAKAVVHTDRTPPVGVKPVLASEIDSAIKAR